MSVSISSGAASFPAVGQPSRATLDAEISQYKRQLADCVNCPTTSSSLEGKATIQDLSSKIVANQNQIRQIEVSAATQASTNNTVQPTEKTQAYDATGASTTFADESKGARLNLFA